MKKMFISIPMQGKTIEQIKYEMSEIHQHMCGENRLNEQYQLIDTVFDQFDRIDVPNKALYCLGHSLQKLAEADIAVFAKGWATARGCLLEHQACVQYGIETSYYFE